MREFNESVQKEQGNDASYIEYQDSFNLIIKEAEEVMRSSKGIEPLDATGAARKT